MNAFVAALKNHPDFQETFATIQLNSWREGSGDYPTIDFEIVCFTKAK
jgi:hypothetical protein